ncbi:hypothetical protein BDC45DRAFT_558587 [Circinella umbellata]|nr:hypothetical protein BDC45DRAFT_558587 [Circinella umbellata]
MLQRSIMYMSIKCLKSMNLHINRSMDLHELTLFIEIHAINDHADSRKSIHFYYQKLAAKRQYLVKKEQDDFSDNNVDIQEVACATVIKNIMKNSSEEERSLSQNSE